MATANEPQGKLFHTQAVVVNPSDQGAQGEVAVTATVAAPPAQARIVSEQEAHVQLLPMGRAGPYFITGYRDEEAVRLSRKVIKIASLNFFMYAVMVVIVFGVRLARGGPIAGLVVNLLFGLGLSGLIFYTGYVGVRTRNETCLCGAGSLDVYRFLSIILAIYYGIFGLLFLAAVWIIDGLLNWIFAALWILAIFRSHRLLNYINSTAPQAPPAVRGELAA